MTPQSGLEALIGTAALRQSALASQDTFRSIKRIVGRSYAEAAGLTQSAQPNLRQSADGSAALWCSSRCVTASQGLAHTEGCSVSQACSGKVVLICDPASLIGRLAETCIMTAFHPPASFARWKKFHQGWSGHCETNTFLRFSSSSASLTSLVYSGRQALLGPEDLLAMLLRHLLQHASLFMNLAIDGAVITVPAEFKERQRLAVRKAAHLAGLKRIQLLQGQPYRMIDRLQPTQPVFLYCHAAAYCVTALCGNAFVCSEEASASTCRANCSSFGVWHGAEMRRRKRPCV